MADDDFTCTIVPMREHGFLWVCFTGEASLGRLTRAHEAFLAHPEYQDGVDELLDFTRCSIRWLSREAIERMRRYVGERPEPHPGKSAVVVSTDVEFGLGRMVEGQLGVDSPSDRGVFRNVRDAVEWLRPGLADVVLAAYEKALRDGTATTHEMGTDD